MTPGVYIVEDDAFPNSVVEVATAVPAFIGYTRTAANKARDLTLLPTRISSLAEYEEYFGGAPEITGNFTLAAKELSNEGAGEEDEAARAAAVADAALPFPPGPIDPVVRSGGVAYYLRRRGDAKRHHMYDSLRSFFQNGGGPCYIVSIGNYAAPLAQQDFSNGIESLSREQEPAMLVFPDAVLLGKEECRSVHEAALAHCNKTQSRFALIDVWQGYQPRQGMGVTTDCIADFRDLASEFCMYGAAYYPWIETTVLRRSDGRLNQTAFDEHGVEALRAIVSADLDAAEDGDGTTPAEVLLADLESGNNPAATHEALSNISGGYAEVMNQLRAHLNLLPPSGSMAGIYARVDNTRGVWKAPANVGISGVVKPSVDITHDQQEDLNVSPTGKSVNAIRSFVGEGTLVWGARTLDGNSLDWRYVSVRRTMIMLEQSIRLATRAYVFEANDANTWITIKSMIRNFLTGIWKRGGLAGASPDAAFSVHVGLGETMTPADILEGILKVTVLVAPTRPAEFIEITFQQQMQES